MCRTPTISVVIPAFNRERFIATAIESVLAQTSAADDIIVVDDGSTDRTGDIARGYEPAVSTITIKNNGSGPSRPRNFGIRAATSSHIMFLDSDDTLHPQIVERHRAALQRSPDVGLVCSNEWVERRFRDRASERIARSSDFIHHMRAKVQLAPNEYYLRAADAYRVYCGWNYICIAATVNKQVCVRLGGFDEMLSTSNDYDFFIRILARHDIVYIDEPLYNQVHHYDNISGARLDGPFRDSIHLNTLRVLRRELATCNDAECRIALQGRMQRCLSGLAYGYRSAGRPIEALRAHANYLREGGPVWAGIRGMAGTIVKGFPQAIVGLRARRPNEVIE